MTFEEYRRREGINFSTLKYMRRSPLHYKHILEHPIDDTPRLILGRAAHCAVFEPERFAREFVVFPGARRAGREWEEFAAEHAHQTILRQDELTDCLGMMNSARSHRVAGPLLSPPGEAEKVIQWTDQATGLPCKARLDWYRPGFVCDLKTTQDVSEYRFAAAVARMGYHVQAAFYLTGLRAVGLEERPFRLIAVEAEPPHDCAVYALDDDAIYAGEQEVAELLSKVAAGRWSGEWPGQAPEEKVLRLPAWAWKQEEEPLGLQISSSTTP